MQKPILIILSVLFLFSNRVSAQNFFYKEKTGADEKPSTLSLDFKVLENSAIQFEKPERLEKFSMVQDEIPKTVVQKREATSAENAADLGLSVMTGLLILTVHDMYQVTKSLKLSSHRGLIFFLFPFENHFLYKTCKGQDYLVASSLSPSPETWNNMKSLDELKDLCEPEPSESLPEENTEPS